MSQQPTTFNANLNTDKKSKVKTQEQKIEEKKKDFFKNVGADDFKRSRENFSENLRKKKREEMFNKKRQHMAGAGANV
jgi:hypothetical protein